MKPHARIGYSLGLISAVFLLFWFFTENAQPWHAPGPANPGHAGFSCGDCHKYAPGTMRQQLTSNVRYALGLRTSPVDFVHARVDNQTCTNCHQNPRDQHPVDRFLEPRFADLRRTLAVDQCITCHQEHTGRRVNVEPTFCRSCHQHVRLKNDPLTEPHHVLIASGKWGSCLRCHPYHGGHGWEVPTDNDQMIDAEVLLRYLTDGPSPWSNSSMENGVRE